MPVEFNTRGVFAPDDFTLIIPAAGRGSRLQFELPKILFPILDRSLLNWLLESFASYVSKVIVVTSPAGQTPIEAEIQRLQFSKVMTVQQTEPLGMADAVGRALPDVTTSHVAIVWGDQIGLSRFTIENAFRLHVSPVPHALTLPTVVREQPYIHLVRDLSGKVIRVDEAREIAARPASGESDCGFFIFDRIALVSELERAGQLRYNVGQTTGEQNLLPMIPYFESYAGGVACFAIKDSREAIGINTRAEALEVASLLRERNAAAIKATG